MEWDRDMGYVPKCSAKASAQRKTQVLNPGARNLKNEFRRTVFFVSKGAPFIFRQVLKHRSDRTNTSEDIGEGRICPTFPLPVRVLRGVTEKFWASTKQKHFYALRTLTLTKKKQRVACHETKPRPLGALEHELGPLRPGMGPPKINIFCYCYFF